MHCFWISREPFLGSHSGISCKVIFGCRRNTTIAVLNSNIYVVLWFCKAAGWSVDHPFVKARIATRFDKTPSREITRARLAAVGKVIFDCSRNSNIAVVSRQSAIKGGRSGDNQELNLGPLAPKGRFIPLDYYSIRTGLKGYSVVYKQMPDTSDRFWGSQIGNHWWDNLLWSITSMCH